MGGLHEQRSQVLVAAFGYLTQDCAISCRLLSRHQTKPGAKVAALPESGTVADRGYDSAGDDRSMAARTDRRGGGVCRICRDIVLSVASRNFHPNWTCVTRGTAAL